MRALRAADRRITLLLATVVALLATSLGGVAGRVGADPAPTDDPRVPVIDFDLVRLGRAATAAVERVRAAEEAARRPKVTLPQPTAVPPTRAEERRSSSVRSRSRRSGGPHLLPRHHADLDRTVGPATGPAPRCPHARERGDRGAPGDPQSPFRHIDQLVPGDRVIFHSSVTASSTRWSGTRSCHRTGPTSSTRTPEYTATLSRASRRARRVSLYVVLLRLVQ